MTKRRRKTADTAYEVRAQERIDMAKGQADVERRKGENKVLTLDIESDSEALPDNSTDNPTSDWRRDLSNIILLLILYTLQGIPIGLSTAIPFLLLEKVSYSEQAIFSLASLPFSLKLLWAPLVDSVYSPSFGRRKSWLVPAQFLCGGMMIWAGAGDVMDEWIGEDGGQPHIKTLAAYFFALYFIMATQDIAVDGWALTMLSRENVGYASTCNTIGQTLGFFISQVGFLALYDPAVCNKYLRSEPSDVGMLSLAAFLQFWGLVFLATTVFVCFFKAEAGDGLNYKVVGLFDTYRQLLKCVRLPSVQSLAAVLLTCRMAFAVTDAATSLKLVEYGMPKEEIAMLSPLLVSLGMVIPVAVGRITAGPKPMTVFLGGYPLRISVTIMYLWVLPLSREAHMMPGGGMAKFFVWLIAAAVLHAVGSNCMFVAQMALFSRVSDPVIGGTYMTLLNTIANLGSKWPNSLSLYLLDPLTFKHCVTESGDTVDEASCSTDHGLQRCQEGGGSCVIWLDGYIVQAVVCAVIGVAWLGIFWRRVLTLQQLPAQAWLVSGTIEKSS